MLSATNTLLTHSVGIGASRKQPSYVPPRVQHPRQQRMAIPAGFRKLAIYLTLVASCILIIRYGLHHSGYTNTKDYSSSGHWSDLINEPHLQLRGLIHVLKTYPDHTLPSDVDDTGLVTPYVLGITDFGNPKEWKRQITRTHSKTPLVVFSKTFCPYSQAAKRLLSSYDLDPAPFIIETNLRNDTMRIKALLTRLTGRGTVPNIILNGRSIGGSDDLHDYHKNHQLKEIFEEGGLAVRGSVDE